MASPSGRACDVTTNRCRLADRVGDLRPRRFSACVSSSSSLCLLFSRSFAPGGASLRFFLVQIAQDLLDAVLVRHRFVERNSSSGTRRSRSRRRPGGGRTASRAPAPRGLLPRFCVAHRRVDTRASCRSGDLHAGQGDEADAGIVHLAAAEQLAQLLANLIADAIRAMSLRHYLRNSISVRVISPGSTLDFVGAAASSCST